MRFVKHKLEQAEVVDCHDEFPKHDWRNHIGVHTGVTTFNDVAPLMLLSENHHRDHAQL